MNIQEFKSKLKKSKMPINMIAEEITDGREGRPQIDSVARALYKLRKGVDVSAGDVKKAIEDYVGYFAEFEY